MGNEFFCPELKFDSIEDCDKEYDEIIDESLNESEYSIAEEIRKGNKSGQDPKFGNWLLETSLDEKWEQLTNDMKLYLMNICLILKIFIN